MFHQLLYWHWIAFAILLLILEIVIGNGFLLWIGISAGCIAFALFLFPTFHWAAQLLGFLGLGILSATAWWLYLKNYPMGQKRPTLNRRAESYIGSEFTLEWPIVNGIGKILADDSLWRVQCADLPRGARIKITGVDGVVLKAEPVLVSFNTLSVSEK